MTVCHLSTWTEPVSEQLSHGFLQAKPLPRCPKIPAEGSGPSGPSAASVLLVAVRAELPRQLGVRDPKMTSDQRDLHPYNLLAVCGKGYGLYQGTALAAS